MVAELTRVGNARYRLDDAEIDARAPCGHVARHAVGETAWARRPRAPVDVTPDPIGRRAPAALPCQTHDPDLWFADAPAVVEFAKSLCVSCPAQQTCLAGAVERREQVGVWGGQIFHHGRIVARKRPRGRPRKDSTTFPSGR